MAETIRILGLDPGLRRTGWGVIESVGASLHYVASGACRIPSDTGLAERLAALHQAVAAVVGEHAPDETAVEQTFVNANPDATLKLGQARGVVLCVPALAGCAVAEYAPNQIKKSVVGSGHAEKQQIRAMVSMLLPRAKFDSDDEADALAVAICHAHHRLIPARTAGMVRAS